MKSDVRKAILSELKVIIIALVLFYLFFQIHYYKENIFMVVKMVVAHFYLFIIPGYSICLLFYGKIGQIERLIIGVGVGYGLQPFLLYLINELIRVKIGEFYIYVSTILIILGILIFYFRTLRKM
jgi:hypothetical protein